MSKARERDLRLDFFRGLAMLIIYVAHVRGNTWTMLIPARFGFSSAAEMFVFCSGYASALAFGSVFIQQGWQAGTARIFRRIWQLYRAHVALYFSLALLLIVAATLGFERENAAADLGLRTLPADRMSVLVEVITLSYVPDFLNILPMYVVLLAFIPLSMGASRVDPRLTLAASTAMWGVVQKTGLNLPAGGAAGRMWFFDPFAWQLMFFTGFAFGMRWLNVPRLNHPVLLPASFAVIALSVPLNFWGFTDNVPALASIRDWLIPDGLAATTQLHFLRFAHFLCLTYVALSLLGRWPEVLACRLASPVLAIGRQSLAAFISSVIFAWIAGLALDAIGHGFLPIAAVNLVGFGAIFLVAKGAARLKSARAMRPTMFAGASTFLQRQRPSLRSQTNQIAETAPGSRRMLASSFGALSLEGYSQCQSSHAGDGNGYA